MSFLNSILGSTGIKEQILKQFTDSFKERGVNKILIEILPNDKIALTELIDGEIIVKNVEYQYLKNFFTDSIKNLTNG